MKMLIEDLVSSAKLRTLAPIAQQTFKDSDVIMILNEEMSNFIVPAIERVREDMWLTSKEVPLVGNVPRYLLPERASGEALKVVFYIGQEGQKYELSRLNVSASDNITSQSSSTKPSGIYLEGSYVRVLPTPSGGGALEMWFYQRPNKLVPTNKCAKVTSITPSGLNTTLGLDTNVIGEAPTGALIDIVSGRSPHVLSAQDAVSIDTQSATIEMLTASLVDEAGQYKVRIGDYVCAAQTTNIPQMPQEFHPILAQTAACRILAALGDLGKLQEATATRDRMMQGCLDLIANRVESSLEYVNSKFGFVNQNKRFLGGF